MKYEDVKACKWLQPLPSRYKFLDAGVVLRTRFSREINFKKEIEAHSPIKVQMIDY